MFRRLCIFASVFLILLIPAVLLLWIRSYRGPAYTNIKEASFKVFASEISFQDYAGECAVIIDKGTRGPFVLAGGYSNLLTVCACGAFLFWKMPVWKANRRYRQFAAAGLCRECGYDIRATPQRCPECGSDIAGLSAIAPKSGWEKVQKTMLMLVAACIGMLIAFDVSPSPGFPRIELEITRIGSVLVVIFVALVLASLIDGAIRKMRSDALSERKD